MNVLIITNQLIDIKDEKCLCIENFRDILLRFNKLGQISLCCRMFNGTNSHNTIDCNVTDIIPPERVHFIKKEYVIPNPHNTKVLETTIGNADLVIGYMPSPICNRAFKLTHRFGKKFLSYLVACTWDSLWNHGMKGKCIAIPLFYKTRRTLRNADYALYVTERFLQRRYPTNGLSLGCSDVRIPTLDDTVLQNRIAHINATTDNKNSIIKVVTVAAIDVAFKGQQYVIQALEQLKKKGNTRYHYYLIGGGDSFRLENLAKKCGVMNQVHFMGKVPHSNIFNTLDDMDVYIQPSLQEGLPRSVVEAMSRGLLCICAKTAAMPEMIDNKYIVRRKSVDDIEQLLSMLNKEDFIVQAKRNFNEAKKYQEEVLDEHRDKFFKLVKADVENSIYK